MVDASLFESQVAAFKAALHLVGAEDREPPRLDLDPPLHPEPDAPVCLIFSPHPDDEALVGGLPLRLRRDHGWRVVNVAVTLGSRVSRRAQRWDEARRSCACLGFELASPVGRAGQALQRITPQAARLEPAHWRQAVERAAALIERWRPRVIQAPHALDGHDAHIGTHRLVGDALRLCGSSVRPQLVWSEYWNTQLRPGLMVELSDADVVRMMAATALHTGEVERHPYHRSLPAWLIDGARRGAERVGAPGSRAQPMNFAALYGWQRWDGRRRRWVAPRIVRSDDDLSACLGVGRAVG